MNAPKAIEQAIVAVLREYGELGGETIVRAWQSIEEDPSASEDPRRRFPQIDVRCAPATMDENGITIGADVACLCGTMLADDPQHATISGLYDAVQGVLDSLYGGYISGTETAALTAFKASFAASLPGYTFGGFTVVPGLAPYDDDGILMIGAALRVHYSRSDY